jgi:hypothetical protein
VLVGSGQMLAPLSAIPTAISLSPFVLPLYALRTTMRMLAALTASLIFTFTYGTLAAKSRLPARPGIWHSAFTRDVLQLSGLLAGDVKESRNDNSTRDLQMASDRTRPHTLRGPVVSSLFSVAARC